MTSGNAAGAGNDSWGQIAGGTHTLYCLLLRRDAEAVGCNGLSLRHD
jgi:hypothetical protein